MELFVMRHGPAEDVSGTGLDADRELTGKGRERVREVARELLRHQEVPRSIFTSPLARALQTAQIVQTELHIQNVPFQEHTWLGMQGRAKELVDRLHAERRDGAMIVGHEPELSELVRSLTGVSVSMEKAMVVAIILGDRSGKHRIRFVLEPKTLTLRKA